MGQKAQRMYFGGTLLEALLLEYFNRLVKYDAVQQVKKLKLKYLGAIS